MKPQRPLDLWGFIYLIVSFGSTIRIVHPINFIGCKSKNTDFIEEKESYFLFLLFHLISIRA
ncbi:hypothetical protein BK772_06520 [Bacillus thuringiensis serovar finitimus]|uniref:Uncharacterized protein n=1 Tax=Bacillus thuringiensis subsp. finitimus TaxID=29337 RepID=A0A243GQS4_BACTF|nr:hypothetical protein ATN06_15920 [Bacillus thuringiensis]OUA10453.1 hypothetical protein BK772_06520 [Bacillus thuringiensis serovar finitimus]